MIEQRLRSSLESLNAVDLGTPPDVGLVVRRANKRRVRRALLATMGMASFVALLGFSLAVLLPLGTGGPRPKPVSQRQQENIPPQARETAIRLFLGEYAGSVAETYGEGVTTLGEWAILEPANAAALLEGSDPTKPIYALFVRGTFEIHGPITGLPTVHPIVASGEAARLVFDSSGDLLMVQIWHTPLPADPAFGPQFQE